MVDEIVTKISFIYLRINYLKRYYNRKSIKFVFKSTQRWLDFFMIHLSFVSYISWYLYQTYIYIHLWNSLETLPNYLKIQACTSRDEIVTKINFIYLRINYLKRYYNRNQLNLCLNPHKDGLIFAKIPKTEKNSEMKEKLFPSGLLTKRDIGEISFCNDFLYD